MTEAQKQKLLLPFPASDIEWRTAYTNTEKTQGFAVPFVNSRAIQERLDEIFGLKTGRTNLRWLRAQRASHLRMYAQFPFTAPKETNG